MQLNEVCQHTGRVAPGERTVPGPPDSCEPEQIHASRWIFPHQGHSSREGEQPGVPTPCGWHSARLQVPIPSPELLNPQLRGGSKTGTAVAIRACLLILHSGKDGR